MLNKQAGFFSVIKGKNEDRKYCINRIDNYF